MLSNLNSVIMEGEITTEPMIGETMTSVVLISKKMLKDRDVMTDYKIMVPNIKNLAPTIAKLNIGQVIRAVGYLAGVSEHEGYPLAAIVAEHMEIKPVKP
jgi:hypothetical protein